MKSPVRVAVTGAAGQISYSLLFRIAAGDMLGKDQPVILQLLEITPALGALQGVAMEIEDCAFPLLHGIVLTDKPEVAFKDADYCLLVGARPRGPGMERKDLLEANAAIFSVQGKAINDVASRSVKVLVVGNPANTNALIAYRNAPDLQPGQFTAMTRLDHNRAVAQLASKTGKHSTDVAGLAIWGNHSSTQYPDFTNATVAGRPATQAITDHAWLKETFVADVQKRGAAVIKARGASSAASAANAALDTLRSLHFPTPAGEWHSVAVLSKGDYGITPGIVFGYPLRTKADGSWEIVQGLPLDAFSKEKIAITEKELLEERATASEALGVNL